MNKRCYTLPMQWQAIKCLHVNGGGGGKRKMFVCVWTLCLIYAWMKWYNHFVPCDLYASVSNIMYYTNQKLINYTLSSFSQITVIFFNMIPFQSHFMHLHPHHSSHWKQIFSPPIFMPKPCLWLLPKKNGSNKYYVCNDGNDIPWKRGGISKIYGTLSPSPPAKCDVYLLAELRVLKSSKRLRCLIRIGTRHNYSHHPPHFSTATSDVVVVCRVNPHFNLCVILVLRNCTDLPNNIV